MKAGRLYFVLILFFTSLACNAQTLALDINDTYYDVFVQHNFKTIVAKQYWIDSVGHKKFDYKEVYTTIPFKFNTKSKKYTCDSIPGGYLLQKAGKLGEKEYIDKKILYEIHFHKDTFVKIESMPVWLQNPSDSMYNEYKTNSNSQFIFQCLYSSYPQNSSINARRIKFIIDSTYYFYDSQNRLDSSVTYTGDTHGKFTLIDNSKYIYNDKGLLTEIISVSYYSTKPAYESMTKSRALYYYYPNGLFSEIVYQNPSNGIWKASFLLKFKYK